MPKHTGPGKGSEARPLSLPIEEFGKNWDAIFGKKKPRDGAQPPAKTLPEPAAEIDPHATGSPIRAI